MILDSGTSNSDIKINDDDHKINNSKIKMIYLSTMCFATNCLSSIALETGSSSSFRSVSSRAVIFNNLFRRNYNLRIKIMIGDVLTALTSTTMLIIGDMYGIPYLYLPWLVNTIEGMAFHEGPALFEFAYAVLPNTTLPAGLFMFTTLLLYVEELCIWKDILMKFKRCWTRYNKNSKLRKDIKLIRMANKELFNDVKNSLKENIISRKSTTGQQTTTHFDKSNNHDITEPVVKIMEENVLIKKCSISSFTEVTG